MVKCTQCKKVASRTRVLKDGVCNECNPSITIDYAGAPCNADDKLSDIKFKDFVEWMVSVFVTCVKESTKIEVAECNKEITNVKDKLNTVRGDLNKANEEIKGLKEEIKTMNKEREEEKKTSRDNCKYLVNHDRSVRQRNVLLMGVPDSDVITVGDDDYNSDRDAAVAVFDKMGITNDLKISEIFRLGKKKETTDDDDDTGNGRPRSRPIKVIFQASDMAKAVLADSRKLKDLFNGTDTNIYIKPDKTKAEREEYARLGKKKDELILRHPTAVDGDPPRVVLKSGRLLVDNVQVDCYKTPQSLF